MSLSQPQQAAGYSDKIKETGMGRDYQLATTTLTDEEGMPNEPGGINGALYLRGSPEEVPSIIINVPSIDDYLKKVEKAGGKVVWQKEPVGDFGFYAQIKDTEGNVIGLWEDVRYIRSNINLNN